MQIDSSLSGYQYQGRIRDIDQTSVDAAAAEQQQSKRGPGNPTVSSTLLSSSLANVLWAVGGAQAPVDSEAAAPVSVEEKAEAQVQFVQHAYLDNEF
jgi:hypothetical protein